MNRIVRRRLGRGSLPCGTGANGTTTGIVSPAPRNSSIRARHCSAVPITPSPASTRGEICLTAPARSPALHAARSASISSANPDARKNRAYASTVA